MTICSLIACLILFWTVKFWGRSQHFMAYEHPIFTAAKNSTEPVLFIKPSPAQLQNALNTKDNLYLNVASTVDQKVVLPIKAWSSKMKPIRYSLYNDIKDDVILLFDVKDKLTGRLLIFNLVENAQAGHVIFFDEIKKMRWERGESLIVTSPYEAMGKSLKDIAPALLFGTTQPEILRLVAMNSMLLIEAVSLRADIVIHPLMIKNQKFYDESLLAELQRRHRKIIVGPIAEGDLIEARALNPLGIIVEK